MEHTLAKYEHKVLGDKDFPVEVLFDSVTWKGAYFVPHWHEHIELHYIISGSPEIHLDQEIIRPQPGDMLIVNSNEIHSGFCDGDPFESLVVIFEPSALSAEFSNKKIIFAPIIRQDHTIIRLMEHFVEESKNPNFCTRLCCKGILLMLLSHLARKYAVQTMDGKDGAKHIKSLARINVVTQYMGKHYARPITNKLLAELVNISEDRFNHIFKECKGVSPQQYLKQLRLEKAMGLLKEGDYMVSEVADAVGIPDYNHFTRLFKAQYGITPIRVRKNK